MYVGTVRVGDREYVRIVESVRVDGKPRPRVIASLGNLEDLRSSIPTIIRGLHRVLGEEATVPSPDLENIDHAEIGVALVVNALWEELGLSRLLRRLFRSRSETSSTELLIRTMVTNRLSEPMSKLGIARWLEDSSMGPAGDEFFARHSTDPLALADRFYKAMDSLLRHRPAVERHLYERLRDLFHLEVDTVFYDLTSTYFEGTQAEYGWFGYSRDERPGNLQVVLGLTLVDGFPVSHQVFKGLRRDATCLKAAMEAIERRFRVRRVVLVGDRGLLTKENIALLREKGYDYILACRKRRDRETRIALRRRPPLPEWNEKEPPAPVVWSLRSAEGERLVGHTNLAAAQRDSMRRAEIVAAFREELRGLQVRLKRNARLSHDARVAQLAEILARRSGLGKRYFTGEIDGAGQLVFRAKQRVLAYETRLDGTTILRTSNERLSDQEIVAQYKRLARIERAFRDLKSFIDLRPVHHRAARRIAAHVFICVLALLFERVIERRLEASETTHVTAERALQQMKHVRILRDRLNGVDLERIAGLGRDQRAILHALGIRAPTLLVSAKPTQTESGH
jgi:transposase